MIDFLGHRFDLVEYDFWKATLVSESLDLYDIQLLQNRIKRKYPGADWVVMPAPFNRFRLTVSKIPTEDFRTLYWLQRQSKNANE